MPEDRVFTADDFCIVEDAIAFIRRRPTMFVGDDLSGATLVERLVADLTLLNAGSLQSKQSGSWYSVSAEKDWLMSAGGVVSFEPFHRLVPMPSGGRSHDRAEILLTALADAVVTIGADGTTWISGDLIYSNLPSDLDLSLPATKGRVVVFHFGE